MIKILTFTIASLAIVGANSALAAGAKANKTAKSTVKAQKLSDAEMKAIVAGAHGGRVENAFRGFRGSI